jgi:hypothetical protein
MERLVASEKKSRVDATEAREAYEASAKRVAAETELRISAEERATTSETKLHAAEAKFRSDEVTTAKLARERADADAAAAIAAAESRAAGRRGQVPRKRRGETRGGSSGSRYENRARARDSAPAKATRRVRR